MRAYIALFFLSAHLFSPADHCIASDSSGTPATTTTTDASVTTTTSTTTTTTVATTACGTCTEDLITIVTGNDFDQNPTIATSQDANGCAVITFTCENNPVGTENIFITYYSNELGGADAGTAQGVGTVDSSLTCDAGVWKNQGVEINEVECQVLDI